jgi:hypothetical protein
MSDPEASQGSSWREERPIIRSNGLFARDCIFVQDVVDAYVRLAEQCTNEGFKFSPETRITVLAPR